MENKAKRFAFLLLFFSISKLYFYLLLVLNKSEIIKKLLLYFLKNCLDL